MHRLGTLRLAVVLAIASGVVVAPPVSAHAAPAPVPRFSHVMEILLENESATSTWEAAAAPHLARLKAEHTYLPNFFAVGHVSLSNYMAAFGAVEPTTGGKTDCAGQPYGSCVFPASVPTIGGLLDEAGLPWKVYSEGMAGAPGGGPCLHSPDRAAADPYQGPGTNGYATRHNPAPWFDSILTKGGSEGYCQAHSVDLSALEHDLQSPTALPAFSFVEPDTCHDGHDISTSGGCALDPEGPGAPAGVAAMDAWLPSFVEKVTSSPAWDDHSLLFITLDEGAVSDTVGCAPCHDGSAGGRVGAVAISPLLPAGTLPWAGDHYSFLRTLEASWQLPTLKSRAATPAAAATVHDGDDGVSPLAGPWISAEPSAAAGPAPRPSSPTATLPATGGGLLPLATVATGLLALGAALIITARPRRPIG